MKKVLCSQKIHRSASSKKSRNVYFNIFQNVSLTGKFLYGHFQRLVFTSDGAGVIIRSIERYDLVKIKQRSRKQSF